MTSTTLVLLAILLVLTAVIVAVCVVLVKFKWFALGAFAVNKLVKFVNKKKGD